MKSHLLILLFAAIANQIFAQSLQSVVYSDGTQKLTGLVTSNHNKKLPGVLILPAWMGIDDEAKTAAQNLEKEGYVAFIADIYGEGNIPSTMQEAAKISSQFKTDYALYQRRIKLALEALIKAGADPENIAVIGYCFGGTGVMEAVRADLPVKGVVSIHGGIGKDPNRPNNPIHAKVLVLHGAADPYVSEQDVLQARKELEDGKADWQLIYFADCKHTFTNPTSPDYNELMANRAWNQTVIFLKEVFS